MIELFKRHYEATVRRGKITQHTKIIDFINKTHEEDSEYLLELPLFQAKLPNNFKQEVIDSIMVRVNMLQKLGVDIEEELRINTEYQETRKD